MTGRRAVVLFNLGGPDQPAAVEPFLFNLFSDPAIITLPNPLRWLIAKMVSRRRAPIAREIYANIGGRSPLLPETEAQAQALQALLNGEGQPETRVFICMRYWHPMSAETAAAVAAFRPDEVVLLPLYPQYSTTTSASSIKDWRRAAAAAGISAAEKVACCYPAAPGFIAAEADLIARTLVEVAPGATPRVLFSAHGLPKKVIAAGDPYQWQVERTAAAVVAGLHGRGVTNFDWTVCYQSRVGPLEWIGPATEDEIGRGGRDGVPLVVVPIAFVSEHSETLVELDIEYRHLAEEAGVPAYHRVPAVGVHKEFIAELAATVRAAAASPVACGHPSGGRLCPADRTACPHAA